MKVNDISLLRIIFEAGHDGMEIEDIEGFDLDNWERPIRSLTKVSYESFFTALTHEACLEAYEETGRKMPDIQTMTEQFMLGLSWADALEKAKAEAPKAMEAFLRHAPMFEE